MPKEFGVKPDTKPSKGVRRLADKGLARFWDIMECDGGAANPQGARSTVGKSAGFRRAFFGAGFKPRGGFAYAIL